jgi:RimJ/RimL family protein N-acetyltransferase
VLEYASKITGLKTIEAWTRKNNEKSVNLLERNGFIRDFDAEKNFGVEKMGDEVIYSFCADQYFM